MGIFSWLFRSRDKPQNSYHSSGWPFVFGKSAAGAKVNEFTAMQTTAVYACVRILAESIAGLPLHVYEYRGNGKERVPGHPLYFLLHDSPNPEMTSFIFRETAMIHLLLWGNSFSQIIRDGMRRVVGLYPLLPNHMSVDRDDHRELVYTYTPMSDSIPNLKSGQSIKLRREDVLHIPGLGFDGLVGYSPIAMARNAVGMTLACEEYGSSFFANGARPGGVLKHPGVLKDPSKLRESWQTPHVTEEEIKAVFVTAFNKLVTERAGANVASRSCASTSASCASEEIAANARLVRQTLCDTSELEQEKASLGQELAVLVEMTQNCIAENARIAQDQGEYQKRYNGLVERYEKAKARFDEVTEAIAERSAKGERLRREASPFRGRGSSGRLRHRGSPWQSLTSGCGAQWWTM